jgi:hypothetical protein
VNPGYGYGYGYPAAYQAPPAIQPPAPVAVASMPPGGLYEQMTRSPGYGFVWIEGSWHWNGYEWAWVSGRWVHQQDGYVYVRPYYDYVNGAYVYIPGYWSRPDHVPSGWVMHHPDGQPPVAEQPKGWHMANPPPANRPAVVHGVGGVRTAPPVGVDGPPGAVSVPAIPARPVEQPARLAEPPARP